LKHSLQFCLILGFLTILSANKSGAQSTYCRYDAATLAVYDQIKRYDLQKAKTAIKKINEDAPGNMALVHMENYVDCITLFITEDVRMYKINKHRRKERLHLIQKLPSHTPEHYFLQADINLHWAAVQFKFGDYFSAFTEIRKAYRLLFECTNQFPGFQPAHMRLSILETIIGTIPDHYQWGAKMIGMEGDVQKGMQRLDQCILYSKRDQAWYLSEALATKALLEYYVNNDIIAAKKALQVEPLKSLEGPLAIFLRASIFRKAGDNDLALNQLSQYKSTNTGYTFYYLQYLKGDSKLRQLDRTGDRHLLDFVNNFLGQNYLKAAYQKLAWHALIFKDEAKYYEYMGSVIKHGSAKMEEDKSALLEAKKGKAPHPMLLKARLLFDGGYYEAALRELAPLRVDQINDAEFVLEYYYRQGRIYHLLDQQTKALEYYNMVIHLGKKTSSYFACNAALLTGQIHENNGLSQKAKSSYKECLSIKPEEYKTGIHQKAKAGLLRLK